MSPLPQTAAVYQDDAVIFDYSDDSASTVWTLPRPRSYVRVAIPRSRWNRELKDTFNDLTALPIGWDGYAGRPVSFACAQFAAALIERLYISSLDAPQLVPVADGSLRLEWHQNQFDVEIDIDAPYEIQAYRRNLVTGQEEEIEVETDFSALADWVNELSADGQVAQAIGG